MTQDEAVERIARFLADPPKKTQAGEIAKLALLAGDLLHDLGLAGFRAALVAAGLYAVSSMRTFPLAPHQCTAVLEKSRRERLGAAAPPREKGPGCSPRAGRPDGARCRKRKF